MEENAYEELKLDNQLCFPLYAASREVVKQYNPFLAELDLTYTQYVAMMVFWEQKKLTAKELGEILYLDSGTLTPVLKSLEKKGLIKRKRSSNDERVLTVEVTSNGEELKKRAANLPKKIAGKMKLSVEEAMHLYQLLYKILNNITE